MARTGRPPVSAAKIAQVRDLLAHGATQPAIATAVGISPRSVWQIAAELGPREADLEPGERRLPAPVRCDHGHLVTIHPCRSCRAMPKRLLLDRQAAAEAKAAALGIPLAPPRRRRRPPAHALDPIMNDLTPAQRRRLADVRRRKSERGEL